MTKNMASGFFVLIYVVFTMIAILVRKLRKKKIRITSKNILSKVRKSR